MSATLFGRPLVEDPDLPDGEIVLGVWTPTLQVVRADCPECNGTGVVVEHEDIAGVTLSRVSVCPCVKTVTRRT